MAGVTADQAVQRAVGCFVGASVGDALGAPFEFGPAGQWSERFPGPLLDGTSEMVGGGAFGWAPGEFTDDTQMAVIVAESLAARGGIDREHQFAWFRTWARSANDVGNLTSEVLGSGLPAADAATAVVERRGGRNTASNGSLMRVAPRAIRFASSGREGTIAAALELSGVTHADPLCRWAVAVAHEMIRVAIVGDDPLHAVPEVVALMPAQVRATYAPLLAAGWSPDHTDVANGTAFVSLAQAVWALRGHESYEGAVTAVIDLGGDTDTVAAITGAIAGARAGIDGIPSRWQQPLHGHVPDADGTLRRYDRTDLERLSITLLR
jgi:ADP-ribosyl-[dinitrogen reductase] hydrolase